MEIGGDTKAVVLAAGLIFLWALLLGAWKYRQMAASEDGLAHPYVDIAHRAALLYSFATLLLAAFVELSGFSSAVDLIAAFERDREATNERDRNEGDEGANERAGGEGTNTRDGSAT